MEVAKSESSSEVPAENKPWPQVILSNLPRYTNKVDLEKFCRKNGLTFRKVKKAPTMPDFAFIMFDTDDEMNAAIAKLNEVEMKGNKLRCSIKEHLVADHVEERKRKADTLSSDVPSLKTAQEAVCPWYSIPYVEQLQRKTTTMQRECIQKLVKAIKNNYYDIHRMHKQQGTASGPCKLPTYLNANDGEIEVSPIISTNEISGYRNKCEFTFSNDIHGKPSLGFRVSSFKDGVLVAPPDECDNVPEVMKLVVNKFIEYINSNETTLKIYDQVTHAGVWRLLTIRYSARTNQLVVLLCISLKDIESELWAQESAKLVNLVKSIQYGDATVTGLCVQVYDGLSVPASDHPVQALFGTEYIMERMNDCDFRVSPQAFFQVNTPAAEMLYSHVIDCLKSPLPGCDVPADASNSICLDICSGTGTIGICCARKGLGNVIGVELCEPAVVDAVYNAKLNDMLPSTETTTDKPTAHFVCSRAEHVLGALIGNDKGKNASLHTILPSSTASLHTLKQLAQNKKLLAVVDPPREGLHPDCLRALRSNPRVERIVYVSCNPTKSLPKDAAVLCGPSTKRLIGTPFQPMRARPVDLFPHTEHCEMVVVFERVIDKKNEEEVQTKQEDEKDNAAITTEVCNDA